MQHVHQMQDHAGKVQAGALVGHMNMALSCQRLRDHEQAGCAVPYIFAILAGRLPHRYWKRRPCVGQKLLAGFVQADQWTLLVKRPLVDAKHVFHAEDELGTLQRRNAPALFQPRFKALVG